jgi:quercetin dioxygenase-like cupin family protein
MKHTATFIPAGAGETVAMRGITMTFKQTAEHSFGLLSVIEQAVEPGAGSPLHQCSREDKIIYVLEGEFAIRLGDSTQAAGAGSMAIIPRGITHNFTNVGALPGRVLVILTPGGHEHFLRELSQGIFLAGSAAAPAISASAMP